MRFGDRYHCLYCLAPDAYELRADKKGRPYFMCAVCGARTFLRGSQSLAGPAILWGPLLNALMNKDREAAQVLVQDAVEKLGNDNSAVESPARGT